MLAPRRRRQQTESRLGHARLVAVFVVFFTASVTYASIKSLASSVTRQQLASKNKTAYHTAVSSSWSDTWRLASELGSESFGIGHRPLRAGALTAGDATSMLAGKSLRNSSLTQMGGASYIHLGGKDGRRTPPLAAFKSGGSSGGVSLPNACHAMPNTDYVFGHPVRWGPQNKVKSARDCCNQCRDYRPASDDEPSCNVWVWCGNEAGCGQQFRDCWLKHLPRPDGVVPNQGPNVPWTAGLVQEAAAEEEMAAQDPAEDRTFHTVITADGSATHWQSRVGYYFFQKTKKACIARGRCDMGGFTRILHSGKADDLMDEIPTFVAQPLPKDKNGGSSYIVINRPYAFVQWTRQAKIKEKFVLMSEPDHLWLRPLPNLMKANRPAGFVFFYIEPSKKEFRPITEKFTGPLTLKQVESIAPMGNAPTMMTFLDLAEVAPRWVNLSLAIFDDTEASKAWGWVQEMYAFTISVFNAGILNVDLHPKMMGQPPWDTELDPYYILHYTYGCDYTLQGKFTPGKVGAWRFDKRSHSQRPPPRHLSLPPRGMTNKLVRKLIDAINEASDAIPGWDDYHSTGVAKLLWDGETFGKSHVATKEMAEAIS